MSSPGENYIFKNMEEKQSFIYLTLLGVILLLNGCFTCSDYDQERDLSKISYATTSVAFMDSAVARYASENKWNTYRVGNYGDDVDESVEETTKNSFAYRTEWNETGYPGIDGVVLKMMMYACTPEDSCHLNFYNAQNVAMLYMELYGCNDIYCENTNRVVVHDANYDYVRVFDKSKFKISDAGSFSYSEFGDNCKVRKKLFFNLVIDDVDFKVDWKIKFGSITCEETHCHEVSDFSVWG